jgi:hypothetical protein
MANKRIIYASWVILALPWMIHAAPSVVCSTALGPSAGATAADRGIAQRLITEEAASWNLAIQRKASAYRAMHAPDFITVTGSGVVGRAASEASAMDAQARFEQCALSAFAVRLVARNAALLTYHVKASGLDRGKAFRLDSYASSLWMLRNGDWLNVLYQATPASH